MTNDIFTTIQDVISSINKDVILLGVDGGQGSGKSTFIAELAKNIQDYNIATIEIDDFLIERDKRENLSDTFFDDDNNIYFFFDFNEMKKTLDLFSKSKNKTIKLQNLYDTKTGKKDRGKEIKLKEKNLIIIGGPYLLDFELDLKIFIDVNVENRLNNTLKRTLTKSRSIESQRTLFNKFEKFYKPYYKNKINSYDIVIDNNNFNNRTFIKTV